MWAAPQERIPPTPRFKLPNALAFGSLALVLSLATPVGLWVLWLALADQASQESVMRMTLFYVTFSTAVVFCVFGFLVGRLVDQLVATREQLALDAREDALTLLPNRREFNRRLHEEILRRQRSTEPLSLIMLDVDHFKLINDQHGHRAGDAVLKEVARQIRACCRVVDLPARYGGEEFAVIAPGLGADAALQVAERIRTQIERCITTFGGAPLQVTVSAGVATHGEGAPTLEALIQRSDEELLRAKRGGRNTVCSPRR